MIKMNRNYRVGDWVIYRKLKCSSHPGPRAQDVIPAPKGETYTYAVEKYWIVVERESDNLVVRTRTGKIHNVRTSDPNLRRPHWWETLLFRERFPRHEGQPTPPPRPARRDSAAA